jgi:4-amino-4-deoxy-L-arabinose transferase-like glycosyltransferase
MAKWHPILSLLLFWLVFIFIYNIGDLFELGPYSIHRWRQSDSASIALSYYNYGMHFWEPKVHNVLGGDNAAVGEFPIYYYVSAALYHVFGVQDGIVRLLHFLTLSLGLFFLFKMVCQQLGVFATYASSIFFAGMGLLAFYAFNLVPDVPALGWMLVGMFGLYQYEKSQKDRWYWMAIAAITLTGLLKPTMLIPYLAWLGTWFVLTYFSKKDNKELFPDVWKVISGFLLVSGVVAAWILWSRAYNEAHGSGIFLSSVMGIWELDPKEKQFTWEILWNDHLNRITRKEGFWMFVVFFAASILFFKKFALRWRWFITFVFLGTLAYFFLFFKQLRIHDYYLIETVWLFFVVLLNGIFLLEVFLKKYLCYFFNFVVLFLLTVNVNKNYYFLEEINGPESRYHVEVPPCFLDMHALRAFIKELGIDYHQHKVTFYPDPSPNITLYAMNVKGFNLQPDFKPEFIPGLKELEVDYLISSDQNFIKTAQEKGFLGKAKAQFEDCIWVFEL